MSAKISKSDQDPRQTVRDAGALAEFAKKTSQHFAPGTKVRRGRGRLGTVVARPGHGIMAIQWEDGSVEVCRPMCLQWEK